jgi:hypothetical protein
MDGASPITTTTPRPLTIQEKVQRKRARNKTPTFNTGSSPRRDQIKQQLVKAMASPTHSIENNRPVSSQQQSRYTYSEEGNGGYNDSTTNMESPLASTENKQVIQSFGMMSHYGSAEEQRENSSQNNIGVKPKAPTRRKLPKWPPDPVNIEKSDDPVNQEPMEQTISQPAKEEREMAKPEQPTVSKGKAPWARNVQTSTSSNAKNTVNSGKPSWVRPVAKEEETGGSQAQSNDTITTTGSTSSPKRGPSWARSRTPSPVPAMPRVNKRLPGCGHPRSLPMFTASKRLLGFDRLQKNKLHHRHQVLQIPLQVNKHLYGFVHNEQRHQFRIMQVTLLQVNHKRLLGLDRNERHRPFLVLPVTTLVDRKLRG